MSDVTTCAGSSQSQTAIRLYALEMSCWKANYVSSNQVHDVPAVIISAALDQCKNDLKYRGLHGLKKPFDADELLSLIDGLISKS